MSEATVTTETPTTAPATTPPVQTAPAANTTPPVQSAAPATSTQSANDWIAGIKNDETRGYVQKKGFKDPEILADSYRNLEKLMGVPKEQILKLPEKFDSPEGEKVWQQLGKPETADGYQIEASKDANPASKEFIDWAKDAFHKSNLTSDQAKNLLAKWNEFQGAASKTQSEAALNAAKAEVEALKTDWGNAYDQKLSVAQASARELGITAEHIEGMQKVLGYKKTMEFFSNLGSKVGESQYTAGNPRTGNGPMDVQTAKAAYAALKSDKGFMQRYMAGGTVEAAEFERVGRDAFPGSITI